MAVTWPFVTVLCDFYLGVKRDRRWGIQKIFFLVPALLLMLVTWSIQWDKGGIQPEMVPDFLGNLQTAGLAYGFYLKKLFLPLGLCSYYPRGTPSFQAWFGILGGLLATAGLLEIARRRKWNLFLFSIAWYAIVLAPVSGIVPIGFVVAADRYFYLPSVALFFFMGDFVYRRLAIKGPVFAAVLLVSVTALGAVSYSRCAVWKDGETLWSDVVAKYPDHFSLRFLGMAQMVKGNYPQAEATLRRSIQARETQYGRFYLAEILRLQGRHEEALAWYFKFNKEQDFMPALMGTGLSLMATNQPAKAGTYFLRWVALEPDSSSALAHLGWAQMDEGRGAEAEANFQRALQLNSKDALAHYNYGVLLMNQSRLKEATAEYMRVLEISPDHQYALVNLGVTLKRQGRTAEARELLERAVTTYPTDSIAKRELDSLQ